MENNFFEKLTIKLDNKEPIEVSGFLRSIAAFQKEYKNVCRENKINYNNEEVRLYIQIREGCIEWDFIRQVVKDYPILKTLGYTAGVYLIKQTADIIIEKIINRIINGEEPEINDKNTLDNAKDFLAVQKTDIGSNMSFTYNNDKVQNYNFNNCVFNGITARGVMDKLEEDLNKDKNYITDFVNEALQLTCTEGNQIRGVIPEFDEKPKVIIFNPKELQNRLIINNEVNPLSVGYIVSGKIKRIDNKILAYIIEDLVETIKE